MIAASFSRPLRETKLLIVDPNGHHAAATMDAFVDLLRAGDVVVVNDAATLPAALNGKTENGDAVELRLLAQENDGQWTAFLLGAGDWHTPTEHRKSAKVSVNDALTFGDLRAVVLAVPSERLVRVRFTGDLFRALYDRAKPVQYAHMREPLDLWTVQTAYASRPWAVEMPSAGRPLTVSTILALRRKGVLVCSLTHAAGLSSSGEAALDARLPLRERYDIPEATAAAVNACSGRVVAIGTSVVRALESSVRDDLVRAGEAHSELRVTQQHSLRVVDALLTGIHDPTASHFELLSALAPHSVLESAYAYAERLGFLGHELGDVCVIGLWGEASSSQRRTHARVD